MFNIATNGIIVMNRGDDVQFPIFINSGKLLSPIRYNTKPFDLVYFSVMEHGQDFEDGVIRKIIDKSQVDENGDIIVTLRHNDTANLLPGVYSYEVKLITYARDMNNNVLTNMTGSIADRYITTVSPKRKFVLLS